MLVLSIFAIASPIIFFIAIIWLGLTTPNYNPMSMTISRLAIEKYGHFQQINFIQLSLGILASGYIVSRVIQNSDSKIFIRRSSILCALLGVVAVVFPTDPIDEIRFTPSLLSFGGIIHLTSLIFFLIISVRGIYKLKQVLNSEPGFKKITNFTLVTGYLALGGSVLWLIFVYFGIFYEYKGFHQKTLTFVVLAWLEVITLEAVNLLKKPSITI